MADLIGLLAEVGLLGSLVVWATLQLGCVLGIPPLARSAARLGRIHIFDDWTMFGTGGGAAVGSRTWFEFRELDPARPTAPWTMFADTGQPWAWHAFAWNPRRRLTDRLRILAKEIRRHHAAPVRSPQSLARLARIAADHLQSVHPGAPGAARQIRIVTEPWRAHITATAGTDRALRCVELEPFVVAAAAGPDAP